MLARKWPLGGEAGLMENPAVDINDFATGFGNGNELGRTDKTAHRMVPAQQGFIGVDFQIVSLCPWLVIDLELARFKRRFQIRLQQPARLHQRIETLTIHGGHAPPGIL